MLSENCPNGDGSSQNRQELPRRNSIVKKKAAILSSNNKIISNLTLSLRDRGDDIENITASPFFSLIFSDLSDIFLFLSFKGTKEGI